MECDASPTVEAKVTAPAAAQPAGPEAGSTETIGEKRREGTGPDRRAEKRVDRRTGLDRRLESAEESEYVGVERRTQEDRRNSLERRRGPGRRRSDDRKSAEEGEMTSYQFEFVQAIQTYKKVNKKMYPTFTEILEILHQLGYRKVQHRTVKLEAPEPELDVE